MILLNLDRSISCMVSVPVAGPVIKMRAVDFGV
jgi:hypothetical protein